MREVRIKLYHQGCWGSYTTERFPEMEVKLSGPETVLERDSDHIVAQALWDVRAPSKDYMDKYFKALESVRDMYCVEVLQRGDRRALIQTKWKGPTSSYAAVLESRCMYTNPPTMKSGYEVYTVLASGTRDLNSMLNSLDEIGEVKILRIGSYSPRKDYRLTERQKEALRIALCHDYYAWPRKVRLEELARVAGVGRVAFQEHLRKAEAKLFPKIVPDAVST